jgi:hypothetical protein
LKQIIIINKFSFKGAEKQKKKKNDALRAYKKKKRNVSPVRW